MTGEKRLKKYLKLIAKYLPITMAIFVTILIHNDFVGSHAYVLGSDFVTWEFSAVLGVIVFFLLHDAIDDMKEKYRDSNEK